jgi:hypothetical protein
MFVKASCEARTPIFNVIKHLPTIFPFKSVAISSWLCKARATFWALTSCGFNSHFSIYGFTRIFPFHIGFCFDSECTPSFFASHHPNIKVTLSTSLFLANNSSGDCLYIESPWRLRGSDTSAIMVASAVVVALTTLAVTAGLLHLNIPVPPKTPSAPSRIIWLGPRALLSCPPRS